MNRILTAALLLCGLGGYILWVRGGTPAYTYRFDNVSRGDLNVKVTTTGTLDELSSVEVMGVLRKLTERGLTIVLATRERDIAQCARRQVVLRHGRISLDMPEIRNWNWNESG